MTTEEDGTDDTDSEGTHDLVVTRVFDAPIERVWKAWSDPEEVTRWWGPEGFTSPSCEMDFREGGTTLVCMRSPEYGDLYNTWAYEEIEPMERIEFVQNPADADGNDVDPVEAGMAPDFPQDVRNVVTFEASGADETELTVTEYGYVSEEWYDRSKIGLEQCLDKMAASVAET